MNPAKKQKQVINTFILLGSIFLAFTFFAFHSVFAAPDQELTYHGKLTDTVGATVADGTYEFTLTIYDQPTGGTCLWTARGNCTTPTSKTIAISKGVFSTKLGETGDNPLSIDFSQNYYLGVTIGTNDEMSPRRKITPTGFALNAHRLNGLTADNYIDTSSASQTKDGALAVNGNFTVNTNNLFVDTNTGNVGIGTTNPGARLDVSNSAAGSDVTLRLSPSTNVVTSTRSLITAGANTGLTTFNTDPGLNGSGRGFQFTVGITDAMRINSTGNIGIGTSSPAAKLDIRNGSIALTDTDIAHGITSVAPTAAFGSLYATNGTGGGMSIAGLTDIDAQALSLYGIIGADPVDTTSAVKFYAGKANGTNWQALANTETAFQFNNYSTNLMTVLGNGNVGIGTTTPSSMLNLFGANNKLRLSYDDSHYADMSVSSEGQFVMNSSYSADAALILGSGLAQDASVHYDGLTHDFFAGIDDADGMYKIGVGSAVASSATIVGPGLVSNSAGGTQLTGTGTQFTHTFRVGQSITIDSQTVTISAITSDTSMTTSAITDAHINATYTYAGGSRVALDANGNFGIGTNSPAYLLDVNGNTRIAGAIYDAFGFAGTNGQFLSSTATGTRWVNFSYNVSMGDTIDLATTGSVLFAGPGGILQQDNTNFFWDDASNRLGIGTIVPQGVIDMGNATAGRSIVWGGGAGTNHYATIGASYSSGDLNMLSGLKLNSTSDAYQYSYTGTYGVAGIELDFGTNGGDIRFFTQAEATHAKDDVFVPLDNEKMRITRSGNVGIGTTNPGSKLSVYSTYTSATSNEQFGLFVQQQYDVADTGLKQGIRANVWSNHVNGTMDHLIGTLSLTTKINSGDITNAYGLYARVDNNTITGTIANAYGLYIGDSHETGAITNDYGVYQVDAGAKNYFGGSVGIGTVNPSVKLDVRSSDANIQLLSRTGSGNSVSTQYQNIDGQIYIGMNQNEGFAVGPNINLDIDPFIYTTNSGNVGIGTASPNERLTVNGMISFAEQAAAPIANAGYGKLYAKNDGNLYYQNDGGNEFSLNRINQITKDFIVDQGSSVTAGDVVSFVNERIKKGTHVYSLGSESSFNSGNNGNDYISITALDSTHFVIAFRNELNSDYGTAIVGTVSGTSVTYGEKYVFSPVSTSSISISAFDSTRFVVAYSISGYGTAIVGTVSGTSITYGVANAFNATATSDVSVTALDATHFAVSYQNGTNAYGVAKIGLVSDTTISSYGTAYTFSAVASTPFDIEKLDATHFVVAYNVNSTGYGWVRVHSVSGTTITGGTASNINATSSPYTISIAALDTTHFIITYNGKAKVGTVSGTTVSSYGTESDFGGYFHCSVVAFDATHFMVTYNKTVGGVAHVAINNGLISGTSISFYGTETILAGRINGNGVHHFAATLDDGHFVVTYENYDSPYNTTAVAGEITDRYLGIAQDTCSTGQSCTVAIDGISTAHANLVPGAIYYTDTAGNLTTTDTGYRVGMAVSSTEIVLQSQGSANESDMYFGDMIFANDFRITEEWGSPLGLIFKNHTGQEIMTLDELGDLRIGGRISAQTMNIGDRVFVDTFGNLGIGTSTPSQIITAFNGITTGTYTTEGWAHSSDARLKTNVMPIDSPLQKVMMLNDVYFNWNTDPHNNRQVGFIAQEVLSVLPEVVTGNESEGYGIAYGNLTALLVGAVQEQQSAIAGISNDQFSISNQFSLLTAKADESVVTLTQLQTQMNEKFAIVSHLLDSTRENTAKGETLRDDILTLQQDANTQADLIAEIQLTLTSAQAGIDMLTTLGTTDAVRLSELLAINPDQIIVADDDGDVTIGGIFVANRIETEEIITEKIIVRDVADDESIAGTAMIVKGAYDAFVPARFVTSHSRIFVTPRGLVEKTLGVTRVDDHSGFHVSIVGEADEDMIFDWFIVEKEVSQDENEVHVINTTDNQPLVSDDESPESADEQMQQNNGEENVL